MKKLYYEDPYLKNFKAVIIKKGINFDNNLPYIILNQTAFYPTGGGQPNDVGFINGIRIIDVEEFDKDIYHYVEEDIFMLNQEVDCEIDWYRRFDHMQQHSGQHVLSAAFNKLFNYKTMSFHLGKETSTIDIESEELSNDKLDQVDKFVNSIITSNQKITAKFITQHEINDYPIVKEITVSTNIRIVIIPDLDYNGCGGTHVSNTSELGGFAILGYEKQKGNMRIEFIFGNRVNHQFKMKHTILKDLSRQLSSPSQQISESVRKLLAKNLEYEKIIKQQSSALLEYEAESLSNSYNLINNNKVVIKCFESRSFKDIVNLTKLTVTKNKEVNVITVLFDNDIIQIACGRGDNSNVDMKNILDNLLSLIEGRGGGNENFAQGKGKNILTPECLLESIKRYFTELM
jgi:alanyl-tRNA synthetase